MADAAVEEAVEEEECEAAAPEPSEAALLQATLASSGAALSGLPAKGVAWLARRADSEEGTREARRCAAASLAPRRAHAKRVTPL